MKKEQIKMMFVGMVAMNKSNNLLIDYISEIFKDANQFQLNCITYGVPNIKVNTKNFINVVNSDNNLFNIKNIKVSVNVLRSEAIISYEYDMIRYATEYVIDKIVRTKNDRMINHSYDLTYKKTDKNNIPVCIHGNSTYTVDIQDDYHNFLIID